MAGILPFFRGAAFDYDLTKAVGGAFDRACHCLHDLGQPDLVREILARRIIEVARRGECDPDELCARVTGVRLRQASNRVNGRFPFSPRLRVS
jgi:hypothetical protein